VNQPTLTQCIKAKAIELGFNGVGVAKAEPIEGLHHHLQQWLGQQYHAGMEYMARNLDKRSNPTLLVPGAKSVISLLSNYYPHQTQDPQYPQIAYYAYGNDYHDVIKGYMQQLWDYIQQLAPALDGRMFVDSAPVADKLWANKAGLGWIGKNSCLINRQLGSYVFISELIINIELDYDEPYRSNFCGSCTKCIDHCPTNAIVKPGVIDSRRCISYQTIENKAETIDESLTGMFQNRLFGCDICQQVCPWNHNATPTNRSEFNPHQQALTLSTTDWLNMDSDSFAQLFKKSALKRAKLKGLQRNAAFLNHHGQ
jgi:epoxyqueuosine reductase